MQKLLLIANLSLLCMLGLYSIASLNTIPYFLKWGLAISYILISSFTFDAINKQLRKTPRWIRLQVIASASAALMLLISNLSIFNFSFFIIYNSLSILFWRKYSFQFFSKNQFNDRKKVVISGDLICPEGVYQCFMIELNKNGCLLRCDAGLKLHKEYNLSLVYNGKKCNILLEIVRLASDTSAAAKFKQIDHRDFNSFDDFFNNIDTNTKEAA